MKIKVFYIMHPESGFRMAAKLAINKRKEHDVKICQHEDIVNFFDIAALLLSGYWSKFHVNIMTDSGVITIFISKGLTRNPEIGNTPVYVLPNIWRLN